MNENNSPAEQPDPAFDRLRAADPAAGVEPDRTALDAAVRARIAAQGAAAQPAAADTPPDQLSAARARRFRMPWWPVAAAAASALLFGTAGFALGHAGESPTATAGGVITLGQVGTGGERASSAQSAVGAAPQVLGGSDSSKSSSMVAPWYGGRTVFTAKGLTTEAGTAQAWTFDAAQVVDEQTANRLAQAFGLTGPATLTDGAWSVGANDGTGPSLQLQPDGLASVSYNDPRLDPYGCSGAVLEGSIGGGAPGPTGSAGSADSAGSARSTDPVAPDGVTTPGAVPTLQPAPTCATAPAGDAPAGDAAVAKARDLITAIGLDPQGFEYETADSGMVQSSYVTAHQVVEGQRTGVTWSFGFVGAGVQSAYGSLAPLVSLGSYDTISATDAVARLTDPRFGASYGGPIMYASGGGVALDVVPPTAISGTTAVAPAPQRTVPPVAAPGSAISWPVSEVILTSARLGLTLYTQPDGTTVLLPAYQLTSDDGQVWSVLAVTDSHLDFAPVGQR